MRVFEEKREEEAAPEQSSAAVAYRVADHAPVGVYLYGLVVLAAFAGATLRLGLRRRERGVAAASVHVPVDLALQEPPPMREARRADHRAARPRPVRHRRRRRRSPGRVRVVSKPRPNAVLKLDRKGKFPAKAIPTVARAREADRLGGAAAEELTAACSPQTVDLGTWCLHAAPYPLPNEDIG